uniref:BTB domain-containing protein n=1 Tax=Scylla olivacea TaxID=85551 RepID=A0A0P4WFQ8_SCYOL
MCGKMAEELLSLKWNNHQAHFVDILTFLREQEIFVDATLACGGKLYAAHKFVLSTCSDYFKQMFTKNPSKHPIVFMKDVTSRDLEALLDFMYNGEVNVPQSSLGSLIKTAEGLQIKGLAVPDDPPAPKRDRDREREKRENRTQLDHHSPPAKRPRPRERSPPQSSPSQPQATQPSSHPPAATQLSRSRSPQPPNTSGSSQVGMPPVEATLDEDSRTSIQSGLSGLSEQNTSTTPSLSAKPGGGNCQQQQQQQQANAGDGATSQVDALAHGHSGEEPSPGPSGLHKQQQSKEEPEFEIKQEDVVDLGEDDEGDWGVEGDGGGGESSLGTENPPNFPEVMLPHSDGTMPATGDPAMGALVQAKDILALPPFQDSVGRAPEGSLSHRMRVLVTTMAEGGGGAGGGVGGGGGWAVEGGVGVGGAGGGGGYGLGWCESRAGMQVGTEERPFPCPYCPLRFKRRYTLQEHVRIHMGSRPYACRSCGKTFTQRSSLLKHVRMRVCQKVVLHK